jgi:hypothetical protein
MNRGGDRRQVSLFLEYSGRPPASCGPDRRGDCAPECGNRCRERVEKDPEYRADQGYLALAHLRKGDRSETRRWFERLRAAPPDPRAAGFWDLAEVAVVQNEVEGLLFDAAFPADSFQGPEPR